MVKRVILYTGKGGVGKTTVAAATAIRCADLGYRTLVMSTDTAHSLGDSLESPIGNEVVKVGENLWAQEVDSLYQLEKYWGVLKAYLSTLLASQGVDEITSEELANLPGMEEISSLLQLSHLAREGNYDVIVVDCAPTGETIQLLGFPDMARWWLEKLFPIGRAATRVVRPVVQPLIRLPLPTDDVFVAAQNLLHAVEEMKEILADTSTTSIRLVLNLEKMVIKESQRAYTYFNLFGYGTDAIIVNKVLPEGTMDGLFGQWSETQRKYAQMIEEAFTPLPILHVPLFPHEVVGVKMLRQVAEHLFGDDDPTRLYYKGTPQKVTKQGNRYILTLSLPFVEKGEVELLQTGHELIVRVGTFKRNIFLPLTLAGLDARDARLEDGKLNIVFSPRSRG
ncbi:MAG: ArsA family ATPase [Armatimonadota bacterium]|nr:ArsA family ATPase [Armatimonadota bacterium]MDR5702094.1 ArsA family ATPase [Armatimonadota bacterium]MDR7434619.1 ArsA family ATPase [Armatimonadota bacterium]